jgi:hypothetical protein
MIGELFKLGDFSYEIFEHPDDDYPAYNKTYSYVIYNDEGTGVAQSENELDTASEANFAAIGHISSLEKGVKA